MHIKRSAFGCDELILTVEDVAALLKHKRLQGGFGAALNITIQSEDVVKNTNWTGSYDISHVIEEMAVNTR